MVPLRVSIFIRLCFTYLSRTSLIVDTLTLHRQTSQGHSMATCLPFTMLQSFIDSGHLCRCRKLLSHSTRVDTDAINYDWHSQYIVSALLEKKNIKLSKNRSSPCICVKVVQTHNYQRKNVKNILNYSIILDSVYNSISPWL